ncbi:anthranilate synthase component I family protein [Lonsdalea quercina]|uniref:anthranilate synthase component I family protein n=1 Tax=Lonsdalea quercina TaxID=71657 RepID=UPI003976067B
MLNEKEFNEYGRQGFTHIPLWQTLTLPDAVEPLALYQALTNQGQDYLFETGVRRQHGVEPALSVIGLPCRERFELGEGYLHHYRDMHLCETWETDDPLEVLKILQERWSVPEISALPEFAGGLFGYFGFETTRLIEPRLRRIARKPSGFALPDALLWLSLELVVIDHQRGLLHCIVYGETGVEGDYVRSRTRLEQIVERVQDSLTPSDADKGALSAPIAAREINQFFPEECFRQAVERIKEYIEAGDVMQVVLSRRMSHPYAEDATTLYRNLSRQGTAPYRYLLNMGESQIVGASPEMLFQKRGARVVSRPMAGTRRRGCTAEENDALHEDLLADPKEIAEHMMLVDLARNDLGRVAAAGSVQVDELLTVEQFPNVMHIVSTVTGQAATGTQALDLLKSTFPAGTLSGASKIRALEVIAELEPHARGVYGGSIGYLDFYGNADQAIAIRTGILTDGNLYVQAGAGVVQDSRPEREWQETKEKSQSMLQAAAINPQQPEEAVLCI